MKCNLDAVVEALNRCYGTESSALAKCNCVMNVITIMEVHFRKKVFGSTRDEQFLDGNFTANLFVAGTAEGKDRELCLSLLEIRNAFVHEGVIAEISDQEIERAIHLTRSILIA